MVMRTGCGKRPEMQFLVVLPRPRRRTGGCRGTMVAGAASDLILPNYLLVPRLQRIKKLLAAAREFSDEFRASLTATLLKMTPSNQFPLVIACYNKIRRRWFEKAPMIQPLAVSAGPADLRRRYAVQRSRGREENFPRK